MREPLLFVQPLERETIPQNKIKDVVMRCLIEFAATAALAAFCCHFVATPAAVTTIAIGLAVQTVVNVILRITTNYFEHFYQATPEYKIPSAIKWLHACSFALGSAYNAQIIVHEIGHATAIHALLKNAQPTMTLFPFARGLTGGHGVRQITWLGKKIGPQNIHPAVAGAGPFLSLAFSAFLLRSGLMRRETSPEISRLLIVSALIDFLKHTLYASSAMKAHLTNFSHDFVALWQLGGIHPIAAAVTIAAVPILMLTALAFVENDLSI